MKTFSRFLRNDAGATAIEYGLLAGLISIALIAAFGGVSNNVENIFNDVSNSIKPN